MLQYGPFELSPVEWDIRKGDQPMQPLVWPTSDR